jgi:hypothetical protein
MTHDDRMIHRDFVQIGGVELTLVFYLGVVEEISIHPGSRWCLFCSAAQLFNNAGDGDKFNLVRISNQNLIQQCRARGVIVTIDETGHDRHLLGVVHLRVLACKRRHVRRATHCYEAVALDNKRFRPWIARIDRIDLRVKHDQIGFQSWRPCRTYRLWRDRAGYACSQ